MQPLILETTARQTTAFAAMTDNDERQKFYITLLRLRRFCLSHFDDEEDLMLKLHYPDFLVQKRAHNVFIRKVLDFEEEFSAGEIMLPRKVHTFILEWWKQHILGTDRKYTRFFNERGYR